MRSFVISSVRMRTAAKVQFAKTVAQNFAQPELAGGRVYIRRVALLCTKRCRTSARKAHCMQGKTRGELDAQRWVLNPYPRNTATKRKPVLGAAGRNVAKT